MDELTFVNQICWALIKRANETNADTMTIEQKGVTFKGENIGDWVITVEKKKTA